MDERGPPVLGNRGAGGNGRRGLPPYLDDGVPGLGLPLIAAGSNAIVDGGGLGRSVDFREGVHGLVGEVRPDDGTMSGTASPVGGTSTYGRRLAVEDDRDKGINVEVD